MSSINITKKSIINECEVFWKFYDDYNKKINQCANGLIAKRGRVYGDVGGYECVKPDGTSSCDDSDNNTRNEENKSQNKTFTLSNGRKAEIKIMPETASEKAIERLGELGFNITLKEVGQGENAKAVYNVEAEKQGKMLGLFKIKGKVSAEIDAETGEVIKVKKPWWSFLASGI